jgi:hypothetical protein
MFAKQQLNELIERREMLKLEADLHRAVIGLECESLRARLAELQAARGRVAAGGPWFIAGGTVAGLLALRHWRKLARRLPTAVTVLRWVQSLKDR